MAKIYMDHEADLSFVQEKAIAILGYGNQGRSQASSKRDSRYLIVRENKTTPIP